jgi:hypothetical protein
MPARHALARQNSAAFIQAVLRGHLIRKLNFERLNRAVVVAQRCVRYWLCRQQKIRLEELVRAARLQELAKAQAKVDREAQAKQRLQLKEKLMRAKREVQMKRRIKVQRLQRAGTRKTIMTAVFTTTLNFFDSQRRVTQLGGTGRPKPNVDGITNGGIANLKHGQQTRDTNAKENDIIEEDIAEEGEDEENP